MKVVINRRFGGFSLSEEAYKFLGWEWDGYGYRGSRSDKETRTNAELVKCVEQLGEKANGRFARLVVVDVPDDVEWEIDDYDGLETIEEKHRTWY